jgi:flagellar secretion chaperone FliS
MIPSNYHQEYLSTRVLAASPVELIRILYEGAVQAVDQALVALHSGDILGRGRSVSKAIEILAELQVSLRPGGAQQQYANTLRELYGYMQRQLMRGHSEQSEKMLQEVSRLLNTLLEGWAGAMNQPETVTSPAPYLPETVGASSQGRSWQL